MSKDLKFSAAALIALLSLALIMLPMPKWVVDLLFTFNIATGLIVLLAALKTEKPLDFAIFPASLLLLTLLRLALNVSSTRLILMDGHTGAEAAGQVIEAFGEVLLGGDFVIGLLLFGIILIINFVVITKGAGRIAEVSARFALDSLPGKQMAIDADLSAGLIGEAQAKERREEVAREADFYGSMDGASKFVRGDALAALLIFAIGSIGGLVLGMMSKGLTFSQAAATYLPLTVGDAIASQVPGLLLSVASAIIVSKSGSKGDLSQTMMDQIAKAGPIRQAGVALAVLGLIPNMPHFAFISFGVGLWVFANWIDRKKEKDLELEQKRATDLAIEKRTQDETVPKELGWEDLSTEEPISLEIGYKLISLADPNQGGDLLIKARALRKKFAEQFGFVPPALRVRDNLELPPSHARILIRGTVVAEGDFYPERLMCLKDDPNARWPVEGIETVDPAFGLPALWIDRLNEPTARALGFTVIQPSAALATLLSESLNKNAKSLFGMSELKSLLEWKFKEQKSISEWVPGQISFSLLLKVCKELLDEHVPLKDFEGILSEVCLGVKKTDDLSILAELGRKGVSQHIASEVFPGRSGGCYILNENLEKIVVQALQQGQSIEPNLMSNMIDLMRKKKQEEELMGNGFTLLVSEKIRNNLSKLMRRSLGNVHVLSFNEVPEGWDVKVKGVIG